MSNFVLGLQEMQSEIGSEDGFASGWTSICCACSWASLGC